MISDVAWDPELPPELMMSGTKRASTIARLSSASKCCIAVAVSISPRKSAQSHPARFLIIVANVIWVYGSSNASRPPSFWRSSVCSFTTVSITSSTVIVPRGWP